MKTIIYISGWLGAGRNSGTFSWLESAYPDAHLECLAPGGSVELGEYKKQLKNLLDRYPDALVLANSYGCFLASFFPQANAIWINPSLYPANTLPRLSPELTPAQIATLKHEAEERDNLYANGIRAKALPVISDSDELIPDHKEYNFTDASNTLVPGGHHKLTDEQRTTYVKPLIDLGGNMNNY